MPQGKGNARPPKDLGVGVCSSATSQKGKQATRPSVDEQTNVGHPCHGNECRPRDSRVGPGGGTQSPATPPRRSGAAGARGGERKRERPLTGALSGGDDALARGQRGRPHARLGVPPRPRATRQARRPPASAGHTPGTASPRVRGLPFRAGSSLQPTVA